MLVRLIRNYHRDLARSPYERSNSPSTGGAVTDLKRSSAQLCLNDAKTPSPQALVIGILVHKETNVADLRKPVFDMLRRRNQQVKSLDEDLVPRCGDKLIALKH